MASHTYDFAKPEDLEDFQRVLAVALGELWARRLVPNLYRAIDGSIERETSSELAAMVCVALRREVAGENYYSKPSLKAAEEGR